jgi:serine protease Do
MEQWRIQEIPSDEQSGRTHSMSTGRSVFSTGRIRGSAAALAAAGLLVGGAAWHGLAAETAATQPAAIVQQASTPAVAPAALGGRTSYADIVKTVTPAVVTIRTEGRARVRPTQFGESDEMPEFFRRFFGPDGAPGQRGQAPRAFRQRGLGSGVVVTADGYVLTNNHVIDGAEDIRVELSDGRNLAAKVIGKDQPSDLALVKVEGANLPVLPLGDSDAVQVGDVVLAVGNPLGIGQTVTMGIISAKGRSTPGGDGAYEDFLQTDAPINHGNSGGALVNLKGELVGINSQIISPSDGNIGIGFAIPANMARHVMRDLRADGRVRRSQLGVTVQPVTSDLAESLGLKDVTGAIVSKVTADSAADRAGVKRGDVIRSFNGHAVNDFNSLRNRVAETAPGTTVNVGIVRDGQERTLSVKLDEQQAAKSARSTEPAADDKAALGVAVEPLTPEVAARLGAPRSLKGVVVREVAPDGRAARADIRAGDIIVEVNRQPVESVEALRSAVRRQSDKPTLLLVHRDGSELFVTVRAS